MTVELNPALGGTETGTFHNWDSLVKPNCPVKSRCPTARPGTFAKKEENRVEVAEVLRVKPKTIRKRMNLGIFWQGLHYFRRKGMSPLFKKSAVIAWVESGQGESPETLD